MKLHVMCYKNILTECFTQPKVIDTDPEQAAVAIARDLTMAYYKPDTRKTALDYENLVLYYIGDFDDQTGIIVPVTPQVILNCFDVIQGLKVKFKEHVEKETANDGKESSQQSNA